MFHEDALIANYPNSTNPDQGALASPMFPAVHQPLFLYNPSLHLIVGIRGYQGEENDDGNVLGTRGQQLG